MQNAARPYVLLEANYRQLLDDRPNVAIIPWGATEAHNYHLPHGTDVIEATEFANRSAKIARERGNAKVIVLPTIPFGNNAQQLDQVATIHLSTAAAAAILRDVVLSLARQNIRRLLILNAHGGNEFKPLVRDLMGEFTGLVIVVANFWQMLPELATETFDEPGDHAGELETSLLLHLCPELVALSQAGKGQTKPFYLPSLKQPGIWTPRPWSKTQPDTGAGNPERASAEKGKAFFEGVCSAIAELLVQMSAAPDDEIP